MSYVNYKPIIDSITLFHTRIEYQTELFHSLALDEAPAHRDCRSSQELNLIDTKISMELKKSMQKLMRYTGNDIVLRRLKIKSNLQKGLSFSDMQIVMERQSLVKKRSGKNVTT